MTPHQITLVQTSFARVRSQADTATEVFYSRLFELDPSLRRLFHSDMREQGRKLMAMLRHVVAGLNRPETITPAVQELGRRHAGYGVQEASYATVGTALLWTLRQALGAQFTPAVETAWAEAYTLLADVMKAAAERDLQCAASPAACHVRQPSASGLEGWHDLLSEQA
jgi:hemoglobin-like flavoprotein